MATHAHNSNTAYITNVPSSLPPRTLMPLYFNSPNQMCGSVLLCYLWFFVAYFLCMFKSHI